MSALVERLISARDLLKSRRQDFFSQEVLDTMADAANALNDAEAAILLAVSEIRSLRKIANRETHWCEPAEFTEGVLALSKMGSYK